jgi:N-acetylglucosaminyl-diphospho-decaprenol L-rhamnosyltransferase
MATSRLEPDVVVVTHNSSAHHSGLVQSLWPGDSNSQQARRHLIVVDSGSTDLSGVPPDECREQVRLPNLGYGSAANIGVMAAQTTWVAIMNPDCRIVYEEIRSLAMMGERLGAGMIGPSFRLPSGARVPEISTLPSGLPLCRFTLSAPVADVPGLEEKAALAGALLIVRKEAFEMVGGFDWGFFLYAEELDLACRLRARGARIYLCRSVTATHLSESSSSGVTQDWRDAQRIRGKARFLRRQRGRAHAALGAAGDITRHLYRSRELRRTAALLKVALADPRAHIEVPSSWSEGIQLLAKSRSTAN